MTLGQESPIWNSEGVGGSAFLERGESFSTCLLCENRFCQASYLSGLVEEDLLCAFAESMHSFCRLGSSGAF